MTYLILKTIGGIMNSFVGLTIGAIMGFMFGIFMMSQAYTADSDIALKLSNMMNSSMLDCVTKQVITKEQVHDIETIFHKHIEINFKGIKANHTGD